jgi:hypothetical protein
MIPRTNKKNSAALLFIIFLIAMPFFLNHFFSNSFSNKIFDRVRETKANTDFTKRSRVLKDNVVLLKGASFSINNCRLVFKGIKDKTILLDLYLQELDPEYAYEQNISKEDATKGFRLGDSQFQLISVNKKLLKLKINNLYQTN